MDCREAERLFDLYLDHEIATADYAALRQHLLDCQRCADNWLAQRKATDLLAVLPEVAPGAELFSRIMMSLPPAHRQPKRLFTFSARQIAAAVVIALALTGVAFVGGSQGMVAATVQQRAGQTIVVPKPGKPLVIPQGSTINGNLEVNGDLYLRGKVRGRIIVEGQVKVEPAGLWARIGRFFRRLIN
jgi:hypothetical protein